MALCRQELGDPLGHRECRQVRVGTRDRRHHRRVGHDEAVVAEHARRAVDHAADRARADRVEEAARGGARVGEPVDLRPRAASRARRRRRTASLAASARSSRRPRRSPRRRAARARKPWSIASGARGSGDVSRTVPRDSGFMANDRRADLVARRAGRVDRREQELVADALGAAAAAASIVTCAIASACERSNSAVSRCRRSVASKPRPTPTWSIRPSPTGSPRDLAAQQDPRRAVRAGGEHDGLRAQLAGDRRHADGAVAVEQHAVDQRVGQDRQVRRAPAPASR